MNSSTDYWATAQQVCTPAELQVLHLAEQGLGRRRIALILHIAPTTARDRLNRAHQKIADKLEQGATA
jgi:DNA-binding CsgD family transcriptional regulator